MREKLSIFRNETIFCEWQNETIFRGQMEYFFHIFRGRSSNFSYLEYIYMYDYKFLYIENYNKKQYINSNFLK